MSKSSRGRGLQPSLDAEERAQYDCAARRLLQEAVVECDKFDRDWVDPTQWAFVKRRQDVSIYRSVLGHADPELVQLLGAGLVEGSLEHVASGLCCDSPEELLVASTLVGSPLTDASLMHASEQRSPHEWFRFVSVKWLAGKCARGLRQKRDVLTCERTGTTTDANGVELVYQTLQTIRRPLWATEATPREVAATCCLYRRHKGGEQTEVFVWSKIHKPHGVPERLVCLGEPGKLLNVVNSARAGQAKNFSALMDEADSRYWEASSDSCHICSRSPRMTSYSQCAGCHQVVCKACSSRRAIFALRRSGRAQKRLFCAVCIKRATGRSLSEPKSVAELEDADRDCLSSSHSDFSTCRSDHSGSFRSPRFSIWRPAHKSWSHASVSGDKSFADQLTLDWY